MKCTGIIFLFCFFALIARAQGIDAILSTADSLNAQPEKAVEILNQALTFNPDSEELLKVRAEAYENLKQYDKSVADYLQLVQLTEDDENLWYLLGRNQYKNGQLPDALKSLHSATHLNSKFLPAFHTKIQVLLQLNRNDDALKVSDSTLRIGETAMNYFLQGEIHKRMNSRQKAEWAYDKATKIDNGFIDAYIALADIEANSNKARETLEAAESALAIDPDSKEALVARSRGFALLNNFTDAIDDVSYVIQLDPDNVNAHYWRGTYYRDANKPQEVIKDFELVLKHQPDYWQAIAGLADAYAKLGNKKMALDGYHNLLSKAANYPEKDAIDQLANQQIFILNRETNAPILSLYEPNHENFDIKIPDNLQNITIKGTISDENSIKSLLINEQLVPVVDAGNDFEFSTVVNIENIQEIQIEVADCYNNVNNVVYKLIRTETVNPQIVLSSPKSSVNGVIYLTIDDESTLYIEGKVTDNNSISSITVNGKAADFEQGAINPVFSAIVDINNKKQFSITATDRSGNTAEQTFIIEKITTATTNTDSPANSPTIIPAVEQALY